VATDVALFTIPAGDYHFGSLSFNITDARRMQISVEGAPRLLFALGAAVVVERADSTTLAGPLSIDYIGELASQSVVTAVGSGCFSTSSLLKVVCHLPLASRALQPVLRGLPRLVELVLLAFMGVLVALSTVRKLRK
jgi:hypothetical protein